MIRSRRLLRAASAGALLVLPLYAQAAAAAPASDLDCSSPVSIGSHACIFPEGQVVIESNLVDHLVDHAGGIRTTSTLLGDTLVHVGILRGVEAQVGWTVYDRERTRIAATRQRLLSSSIGDVSLGGKLALLSAADGPLAIAVQPTLMIPVGSRSLGGGEVGGSLVLPISYDLSEALTLDLTPEGDLTGDRADDRRHLEYGATLGLDWSISDRLSSTVEYSHMRDRDPAFHRTRQMLATSLSWLVANRCELNAGVSGGLTARSPRHELTFGLTRHFL